MLSLLGGSGSSRRRFCSAEGSVIAGEAWRARGGCKLSIRLVARRLAALTHNSAVTVWTLGTLPNPLMALLVLVIKLKSNGLISTGERLSMYLL